MSYIPQQPIGRFKIGKNNWFCTTSSKSLIHHGYKVLSQISFENCGLAHYIKMIFKRCSFLVEHSADLKSKKDRILKLDCKTKEWKVWKEDGVYPSEPVFVNRPGGKDEEDGVVLSVLIYSDQTKPIQLLVLDPTTLTEIARCSTNVTSQPYAFHHTYFPIDFDSKTPKPPAGQLPVN